MHHNMILSASGWRKIFTESGDEEDSSKSIGKANTLISILIGETFAEYLLERSRDKKPTVIVGRDTRPTGAEIAKDLMKSLLYSGITVHYTGIVAAPEIMAYAKKADAFVYISASHNPIGHNGIKFGMSDGGVLPADESKRLIELFERKCSPLETEAHAWKILSRVSDKNLDSTFLDSSRYKKEALQEYDSFIKEIIAGSANPGEQEKLFSLIRQSLKEHPLTVVIDMNGSARTCSIDKKLMDSFGIRYDAFNDEPGQIAHAIIPEPENLVHCAKRMTQWQETGDRSVILGYMPDCDGDRGNIVFWDEKAGLTKDEKVARPIPAQEVFALCVMAESTFGIWKKENLSAGGLYRKIMAMLEGKGDDAGSGPDAAAESKAANTENKPTAVAVNCPTSMRIDEICDKLGIRLFRAEVGEANVVQLAQKKRDEGYEVRILGEGSNGGNITHPSRVRDPLATLFAIIKLLSIRDRTDASGKLKKGLFHIWCERSGQEYCYTDDFTLSDVLETLPRYTTTGVSEPRAVMKVTTKNMGLLKECFQKVFREEWEAKNDELEAIYAFSSYEADTTNGTEEVKNVSNWNNGKGGLKVRFLDKDGWTRAFIWMRPSGTEPVFRILCDVKGDEPAAERSLLRWESSMLRKADELARGMAL
ncbi:MAG: phosphoglucomutase [Treponema sp.]|nr:phosphoglucomutase [Treponema sp.]